MRITEGKLLMNLGQLKKILTEQENMINTFANKCEEETLIEIPESKRNLMGLTIEIKRNVASDLWELK